MARSERGEAMANITAGKWEIVNDNLVMDGRTITHMSELSPPSASYEEAQANARLIAGAPELADTLKNMTYFLARLKEAVPGWAELMKVTVDDEGYSRRALAILDEVAGK